MKFKSDSVRVREAVRVIIHDRKIPMTRLALASEINYSTLRAYLAGRSVIRVDMLERILSVLEINLSDLILQCAGSKITLETPLAFHLTNRH